MDVKNYKFLVVDDHAMIRQIVVKALMRQGAKDIELADDGREALSKITSARDANDPYDIVFLDWNMPHMNGFEMLVECRVDSRLNNMAIIMLTAESEEANVIKALAVGVTAYITKPFKEEVFLKRLSDVVTWLEKRKATALNA